MSLQIAAMEVLARVRANLRAENRGEIIHYAAIEVDALHSLNARQHAEWAARRLVFALRDCPSVERELREAELWARKKLRRGYLVRAAWLDHAYETALRLAQAR